MYFVGGAIDVIVEIYLDIILVLMYEHIHWEHGAKSENRKDSVEESQI